MFIVFFCVKRSVQKNILQGNISAIKLHNSPKDKTVVSEDCHKTFNEKWELKDHWKTGHFFVGTSMISI